MVVFTAAASDKVKIILIFLPAIPVALPDRRFLQLAQMPPVLCSNNRDDHYYIDARSCPVSG
jgi:hypothetical protein